MRLWDQLMARFGGTASEADTQKTSDIDATVASYFGSLPSDEDLPDDEDSFEYTNFAKTKRSKQDLEWAECDTEGQDGDVLSKRPSLPPTLHFAGWGYDDREDEYTYKQEGKDVVVEDVAGSPFVFRKMDVYILCRAVDDQDERAAWFLQQPASSDPRLTIQDLDAQQLARQAEHYEIGRCLLHVADCMTQYQCAYLLFAPDGTGITIDYTEEPMVDFHWNDMTTLTWREVLTADPEILRPLCRTIFDRQINPRLTNPYIDPTSLQDIPHRFECGSEAELRRLTVAIVCTEPGLFEENRQPITVTYRAKTPTKRAYMMSIKRGHDDLTNGRGRMQSLCDLALRLNTFTGYKWETWMENPNRLGHFQKRVHQVRVEVQPPSAHEQAESLLVLADWLEGKVRPEKRLRLLGLDEADAMRSGQK